LVLSIYVWVGWKLFSGFWLFCRYRLCNSPVLFVFCMYRFYSGRVLLENCLNWGRVYALLLLDLC